MMKACGLGGLGGLGILFAWAVLAGPAHAQAYRCNGAGGGAAYYSDRPCVENSGKTRISVHGPARTSPEPGYGSTPQGVPRAEEHAKYLSSGCASILEAMRTGPARGVRGDVLRGLREEYQQKCALEDQDARRQWNDEKSQQYQQKLAQRDMSQSERQEAKRKAERCSAMKDVIVLKRKRESELNAKEVEALRELEKTYNESCIAR